MTQEQFDAIQTRLNALETKAPSTISPVDNGGVKVNQYRTAEGLEGKKQKVEETVQYYDADTFAEMNRPHPQDEGGRSRFEILGISYDILEDTRTAE